MVGREDGAKLDVVHHAHSATSLQCHGRSVDNLLPMEYLSS